MRRTARVKQQAQMLAAGVALLALILCSLFFILQGTRPSGAKMMEKALAQLEQQQNYNLAITEKAPQYKLFFQGRVENGNQLRGILRDYNLEVLSQEGRLRLKQEEASEWAEADTLGLQGLSGFLITPLELLQSKKDCFPGALAGEKITLDQNSCQTVYFTVSGPEQFVQRLFPEIDYTGISEVTVGAALAEPDLNLKQLRILVEFTSNDGEQIERSYYFDW